MEDAIWSKGLTRRFGKMPAVEDLDLHVPKGMITAFLGPNGAGKTTTIRLLLGLLKPHSGVCGTLGFPSGHPTALARIGALVEYPSLYDHLTGFENVEITRLMKNAASTETERVLSLVGLSANARRPVRTYSLGMRQRLGMALALVGEPQLLILDEPNNGLDPAGILEMRELIRSLTRKMGITIFVSSHVLAEVEQIASHVVVIHHGRLRYQGPMEEMGVPGVESLRVRVKDAHRAMQCLSNRGYLAQMDSDELQVETTPSDAPHVAALLVGAGFELYELGPRRVSLESRFLHLLESA